MSSLIGLVLVRDVKMTWKGHFWSVAKAVLRIWCWTWNSNLESYLIHMYRKYVEITILIQLNLHSQMLEYESFEAIQLLDPNSTFFVKHIPILWKTLQVMIFKHNMQIIYDPWKINWNKLRLPEQFIITWLINAELFY